jgi:hypothetical protein
MMPTRQDHERQPRDSQNFDRRGATEKASHAERRMQSQRRGSLQERESLRQIREFAQGGWR